MRKLIRRFRNRRFEQDLADELDFHRAMVEQELGDPHAARRAMGNETLMREDARAVWIPPLIEGFWQDVRYAVRTLRQSPGFTLSSIGVLALAIGCNTSVVTVYNSVAVRPWPVTDPSRVVTAFGSLGQGNWGGFSLAEYRHLRDHAKSLSGAAAFRSTNVRFGDEAPGKTSAAQYVSGNFFDVLGIPFATGRGFRAEEDRVASPAAVAVLPWLSWQNRFGGDPAIVGRTVKLDDIPFTVVGVTAEEFTGTSPGRQHVYLPLAAMKLLPRDVSSADSALREPGFCCSEFAARLAPGVTRKRAAAELELLSGQFRTENRIEARGVLVAGTQFFSNPKASRKTAGVFALLYGGVTLVFLLACANVGNLCIARALARRREIAIRASIGASRTRVVRQLLTEGLVLASIASAIGLLIAGWLPAAVVSWLADSEGVALRLTPDSTVAVYAVAAAAAATLLFGLAPALTVTRTGLHDVLKGDSAGAGSRFRLRTALLAAQTAIGVVLLVAAGLMTRGVQKVANLDPGFSMDGIAALQIGLPADGYTHANIKTFTDALSREVSGVREVALSMPAPLAGARYGTGFTIPGRDSQRLSALMYEVSPSYFDLLRIPIVAGRGFTDADRGRDVVLVNEAMQRRFWPGDTPIGKSIAFGKRSFEIAGIVKDVQTYGIGPVDPAYYRMTSGNFLPTLLVRNAEGAVERATAAVQRIQPAATVRAEPLRSNFDRHIRPFQVGAAIAGSLGLLGLLLAAVGLAGVCAYVVQQRTKEIGVRMALGATRTDVIRLVMSAHSRALCAGLAAGVAGALLVTRLLEDSLYGISKPDAMTYGAVLLVLALAAVAATALPVRRATSVDVTRALRYQ